jgi:bifunctional DNase/RNase
MTSAYGVPPRSVVAHGRVADRAAEAESATHGHVRDRLKRPEPRADAPILPFIAAASPAGSCAQIRSGSLQEMVIYGVSFDMVGKQPIVLLKTVDSNKFLPIWIGHPEAAAILMKLQGASTPRPMTHDLLVDVLGELEVKCAQVAVTELRDNTFFATITLSVNGREVEIDSRPSDALALAVRSGAPIFAAEEVIAESAIEFEHEVEDTEEVVDRFKQFLDEVTPEDFAGDS